MEDPDHAGSTPTPTRGAIPKPERFAWPPREAPATPFAARPPPPARAPRAPSPIARAWRDIEDHLLGVRERSWSQRDPGEAHPDPMGAYCTRCLESLGPHEGDDQGCPRCRDSSLPWAHAVRLGRHCALLRRSILQLKFTCWRRQGLELGRDLGRSLEELMAHHRVARERVVLVPIPTTLRRRTARGIDHALVITKGVRDVLRAPIVRALTREHRPAQAGLPARERARNVAGSMRLRRGVDLSGRLVVLVDDVLTTGATMREASRGVLQGYRAQKRPKTLTPDLWVGVLAVARAGPAGWVRRADAGALGEGREG